MTNWPNAISVLRIFLTPVALTLQQLETPTTLILCVVLMVLLELSDVGDGYLARRLRRITDVGKIIDPLADSVYRFLLFLGFLASGWMPLWMVAVIFLRDILVAYVRIFAAINGIVLGARLSGKVKAIVQAVAQILVVLVFAAAEYELRIPAAYVAYWILLIATLITAYSAVDYIFGAMQAVSGRTEG